MKYLIDEQGIHLIEDAEADRIAALQAEPVTVEEVAEIPMPDAVRACHDISEWIERLGDVDSTP